MHILYSRRRHLGGWAVSQRYTLPPLLFHFASVVEKTATSTHPFIHGCILMVLTILHCENSLTPAHIGSRQGTHPIHSLLWGNLESLIERGRKTHSDIGCTCTHTTNCLNNYLIDCPSYEEKYLGPSTGRAASICPPVIIKSTSDKSHSLFVTLIQNYFDRIQMFSLPALNEMDGRYVSLKY